MNKLSEIPTLTDNSTWADITQYLKWLWNSPFQYHLDDNIEDIEWSAETQMDAHKLQRLVSNDTLLWEYRDENISIGNVADRLWGVYYHAAAANTKNKIA